MSRKAFTILELLIVIGILAILAGLLLPAISLVRDSARASICRSNLRQIGVVIAAYSQDNEGLLAPSRRPAWIPIDPLGWSAWNWRGALEIGYYFGNDKFGGSGNYVKILGCPIQQAEHLINPMLLHGNSANTSGWATYSQNGCLTQITMAPVQPDVGTILARIGCSSDAMLVSEGIWATNNWGASTGPTMSGYEFPHRGSASVLYVDGHVGSINDGLLKRYNSEWGVAGSAGRNYWLGNL